VGVEIDTGDVVALFALGLGIYNLYFSNFRVKNALYLVRNKQNIMNSAPCFGIVNSGNRDVLVTQIQCWLSSPEGNSSVCPDQKIEIGGENIHVLQQGKFLSCTVKFKDQLGKEAFDRAYKTKEGDIDVYKYNVDIHISWINSKSEIYHKVIHFMNYDYLDMNYHGLRFSDTDQNKFNLYKKKTSPYIYDMKEKK